MKRKVIMFTLLSALLGGCRTHEYCGYESIHKEALGGQLSIGLWSDHTSQYEKEGKKFARHGFPYTLEIGLSVDLFSEHVKSEFILISLKAKGVESGKTRDFKGGTCGFTKVRSPSKEEKYQAGFSSFQFSIKKEMGLTYEPFDIEADIKIIHADGTEKSELVKVRLEKDYKKKRQSDTWDRLKSI